MMIYGQTMIGRPGRAAGKPKISQAVTKPDYIDYLHQ